MADTFISYSRKDQAFVRQLEAALKAHSKDAWIDWEDIPPAADFPSEIRSGIEGADAFVFVLSPDSVASPWCLREMEHAQRNNKRLLPILRRELSDGTAPEALANLHWIYIREGDDFEGAINSLIEALETDLAYVKAHTRLQQKALEWDGMERDSSFTLRGKELREAQEWQVEAAEKQPAPTQLQQEYLLASQQDAMRRQRITLASVAFGLVVAIGLAVVAFIQYGEATSANTAFSTEVVVRQTAQSNAEIARATAVQEASARSTAEAVALEERDEAQKQANIALSRQLAAQSDRELSANNWETAMLLAIEAGRATETTQAYAALRQAFTRQGRLLFTLDGSRAWFNPERTHILTSGCDYYAGRRCINNPLRLYDADSGELLTTFNGHGSSVLHVAWSEAGDRLLTASTDRSARVWDVDTGEVLLHLYSHTDVVWSAEWNPDESRVLTVGCNKGWEVGGCEDGSAKVWDANTGEELFTLSGSPAVVRYGWWNVAGNRILTAGCGLFVSPSECSQGMVQVWDADNGAELLSLTHPDNVTWATWNKNESSILSTSIDGIIRIWDAETGDELLQITGQMAAWDPDGSHILTMDADIIQVWDAQTGDELNNFKEYNDSFTQATWNASGNLILIASMNGSAWVWDPVKDTQLTSLSSQNASIIKASWNEDESHILTVSEDSTLRVYDASSGSTLETISMPGSVSQDTEVSWSSNGERLLCPYGIVQVFDGRSRSELPVLPLYQFGIDLAQLNADGSRILTVSNRNWVQVWNVDTGVALFTYLGHTAKWNKDYSRILMAHEGSAWVVDAVSGEAVLSLRDESGRINQSQWNTDESRVLTVNWNNTLRVWDVETEVELYALQGGQSNLGSSGWIIHGDYALTTGDDNTIHVWDINTGTQVSILSGHEDIVSSAEWSPDGSRVLSGSWDNTARIWDAQSGEQISTLSGVVSKFLETAWNATGNRVMDIIQGDPAQEGDPDKIRIWDVETGENELTIPGHTDSLFRAIWNADGDRILTTSGDGTARLWDAYTGDLILTLSGHTSDILGAIWNKDESRILTTSMDNTARVWDAQSGSELDVLLGHTSWVSQASWFPDETRILTIGQDGTLRQYYTRLEDLMETACQRVLRNMTREEWRRFMGAEEYRLTCPDLPIPSASPSATPTESP